MSRSYKVYVEISCPKWEGRTIKDHFSWPRKSPGTNVSMVGGDDLKFEDAERVLDGGPVVVEDYPMQPVEQRRTYQLIRVDEVLTLEEKVALASPFLIKSKES